MRRKFSEHLGQESWRGIQRLVDLGGILPPRRRELRPPAAASARDWGNLFHQVASMGALGYG